MNTATKTEAPSFADLWAAKNAAQARIGSARKVALDVSPAGVFVGYWLPRKSGKGSEFDCHAAALSRADAIAYLSAVDA